MTDLVSNLKQELVERLRKIDAELEDVRGLIDEKARIEHALAQPPFTDASLASRRPRRPTRGPRAPRGANRNAALSAIRDRPGITLSALHDVTGIAKPTLSGLARTLTDRGEIVAEDLPGGQRGFRLNG